MIRKCTLLCTTIAMSCDVPTKGNNSSLLCCSNMDFVMSQRATTHHPGVCSTTPNLLHDASKCNCISFDRKLFFLLAFGPEEVSRNDHQGVARTPDLSIWLECHARCDTLCCSGLCCIVTVKSFAVWFQTEAEANIFPHS